MKRQNEMGGSIIDMQPHDTVYTSSGRSKRHRSHLMLIWTEFMHNGSVKIHFKFIFILSIQKIMALN